MCSSHRRTKEEEEEEEACRRLTKESGDINIFFSLCNISLSQQPLDTFFFGFYFPFNLSAMYERVTDTTERDQGGGGGGGVRGKESKGFAFLSAMCVQQCKALEGGEGKRRQRFLFLECVCGSFISFLLTFSIPPLPAHHYHYYYLLLYTLYIPCILLLLSHELFPSFRIRIRIYLCELNS